VVIGQQVAFFAQDDPEPRLCFAPFAGNVLVTVGPAEELAEKNGSSKRGKSRGVSRTVLAV